MKKWIPCDKKGLPITETSRKSGVKWYGYKCSECNFIYHGNALTQSPYCQNCGVELENTERALNKLKEDN